MSPGQMVPVQCYMHNLGHGGHGKNVYGVIMTSLHTGGHSDWVTIVHRQIPLLLFLYLTGFIKHSCTRVIQKVRCLTYQLIWVEDILETRLSQMYDQMAPKPNNQKEHPRGSIVEPQGLHQDGLNSLKISQLSLHMCTTFSNFKRKEIEIRSSFTFLVHRKSYLVIICPNSFEKLTS